MLSADLDSWKPNDMKIPNTNQKMEDKLEYTKELIGCWYEAWGGQVAVSFSGGKDSTVLQHIVRSIYPDVKSLFSNTGLEYPEIVSFVKEFDNVDIVRPKKPFHKVIEEYGWPIISKKVARSLYDLKNPTSKNENIRNLYLTGFNSKGQEAKSFKLSKKWIPLVDSPFKISNKCCDYLKKEPIKRWVKENGLVFFVGTMAADSYQRRIAASNSTCNLYDSKHPQSRPLTHWTEDDIWEYIKKYDVKYCSIYDKGEKRTGCVFCMFGIMFDKNRFIRLKENSPTQWDFVINKLGGREVLDYIGIKCE